MVSKDPDRGASPFGSVLLLVLASVGMPSCAALASWDGFAGADDAKPRDGSGHGPAGRDGGSSGSNGSNGSNSSSGSNNSGSSSGSDDDSGPGKDPPTPISAVQNTSLTLEDRHKEMLVPLKQAQNAGDLNVVAVGWYDNDVVVQSVSDSAGNTYEIAVDRRVSSAGGDSVAQMIFFSPGIAGAATNTITVVFSGGGGEGPDIRVIEFAGLDRTNPLDASALASSVGTSATSTTGPVTTTIGRALLFSAGTAENADYSAQGPTFTGFITPDTNLAEWRVVDQPGTYSASGTLTQAANTQWVMQLVAFH
jgi:hypothetical protein